jgi:hypothetical protein
MPMRTLLPLLALTSIACKDKDGDTGGDGAAQAEALWDEMNGYSGWPQVAPWEGVQASGAAHGAFVQIWVNDVAQAGAAAGGTDFAEGSVLVKESYDSADGGATGVTAMKKTGGAGDGGWIFAKFGVDGTVELAGDEASGGCAGCHSAGPDYSLAWSE